MKVQHGIKISAAALFASFVVFAPARAAIQQTPTQDTPRQDTPRQDTPHQDTPVVVIPSTDAHEEEEELQRAAAQAAHEAAEEQERAAKAAHEAEEELQRAAEHAAHEAAEDQERAAEAAAKAAHEAQEALERAAKDAANSVHEAEEERQRAIAKALHEAEEQQQRAAKTEVKSLEDQAAMDVTVVGCVIREREYRKVHHDGKGGAFGMGIGGGNEYILVGATRITDNSPVRIGPNCDPSVGGDAYELTGKGESSMLRPYLGHWVELTGKLKKAEITKETRGTANPRPTGGKGPFWQDLKIFEINVYAVKDYVPPTVVVIVPRIQERAAVIETPQPEVAETPEPAAVATAGREELPKTARSMPLVALLGVFFVAAAIAIRVFRGITGRIGM